MINAGFSETVVLVAGGTGGLGRAVTLAFLRAGARVFVTWQDEGELASLKESAGADAAGISARRADVTDETAVKQLIDAIIAEQGRLDALVNTVGGYAGGKPLWETPDPTLDHLLTLNLRAGFLLASAAAKVMLPKRSGAIVNIAAKAAYDHPAGLGAYAASKAAAAAMIDSLAADLRGTGVRVNSVLPSIIDTEPNRRAMPNADFSTWPKPEEIAQVILFLCSDHARVIHGAAIPVYGNA
jgi:NAD(P)-dependent dehydrogenase (short-subunit alcohol dehydrogenase family)